MNQSPFVPNPYDVLEVSPEASKKEITVAFAMAMKRRQYSSSAIATARKSLINPQARIVADYLRPKLTPIQRFKRSDFSALNAPIPELELLLEFYNLEQEIEQGDRVLESDKRLGEALFSDYPDCN